MDSDVLRHLHAFVYFLFLLVFTTSAFFYALFLPPFIWHDHVKPFFCYAAFWDSNGLCRLALRKL